MYNPQIGLHGVIAIYKVKIVKSMPKDAQDGIENLIGKLCIAWKHDAHKQGELSINSIDNRGIIVINKGEYEIIK